MYTRFGAFVMAVMMLPTVMSLHFYLEAGDTKCFYEDLPKDTLVVGKYDALEYNKNKDEYFETDKLLVEITVDETFDNDHRVVQQKGASQGEFTFTSLDSGEHKFCLTPRHREKSWLSSTHQTKMFLDLAIGEATEFIDSKKTDTMNRLQDKVNQLTSMLDEIQRHQQTIRDQETEFRDTSVAVSFNVVKWTLVQTVSLLGVGYFQMRYLRYYFKKEKVV